MKLQLESHNGTHAHVAVSGTVADSTPAEDPLKALEISDIYSRGILLNMHDVRMLNSHGVGWLLRTHKLCQDAGGRLVLHSLPQLAHNVLKMMRLTELLQIAVNGEKAESLVEGDLQ